MSNFIKDALRTESTTEVVYNPERCLFILQQVVQMGNVVDALKKGAFYRKPEALAVLEQIEFPRSQRALKLPNDRVLHAVLGCITEASEMAEALIAEMQGEGFDRTNMLEESGDILWYLAILFDELGSTFETEEKRVIDKLKERFPNAFTEEAANNRDLEAERKVLEASAKLTAVEELYEGTVKLTHIKRVEGDTARFVVQLIEKKERKSEVVVAAYSESLPVTSDEVPTQSALELAAINHFYEKLVAKPE